MAKRVVIFIVLLAVAAVVGRSLMSAGARDVTAVHPKRGTAVEAVYATGVVEPVFWAKLTAPMGGRVLEIVKDEGDWVEEGDIVARLDDRVERAEIQQLYANGQMLYSELKRQRVLIRKNVSSERTYEQTLAQYKENMAAMDAAKKRLSDMVITAPMRGQVLKKLVEAGEFIKAGDPAFWVGMPKPLQIVAEVDEEDIPKVAIDQVALIKADAYENRVIEGTVSKIIPKGDPINKVFLAEVTVPEDSGLYIGMTVEVNVIVAKHENALLVPVNSYLDGKVWVVDGGDATRRKVTAGIVGEKTAEIQDGLNERDTVISPVPDALEEGESVSASLRDF